MKLSIPVFSKATFRFLNKASRQKSQTWLEKNREEYDQALVAPLKHLAESLKRNLQPIAPGYHFPQKGMGRVKRPSHRAKEYGSLYKDWVTYSVSRPSESRFERNPSLFFLIQPKDHDDPVLVAGGLYMPSSRQVRSIREAIAADATPFDRLFASKEFKRSFKDGFSDEQIATRPPRGFDREHPRMDWLKLQAFFVWKPYTFREFTSKNFSNIVTRDWQQVLRLNELLDKAITGHWAREARTKTPKRFTKDLLTDRLEGIQATRPEADF